MKVLKKTVLYISIFLILLLVVAIISTQTPWFKDELAKRLSVQLSDTMAGTFQIKKIRGNLFRDIEIIDLTIADQQDTLLYIPYAAITYSPLHLMFKQIRIKYIGIKAATVHLIQHANGRWNFTSIFSANGNNRTSSGSKWQLYFDNLVLQKSNVDVILLNAEYNIQKLDLKSEISYAQNKLGFDIQKFNFEHQHPDLSINSLKTRGILHHPILKIDAFGLVTQKSRASLNGRFDFETFDNSVFRFRATPLHSSDIKPFFDFISFNRAVSIKIDKTREKPFPYRMKIAHKGQSLQMRANLPSLQTFTLNATLQKIDAGMWLQQIQAGSALTGNMRFQRQQENMQFRFDIDSSRIANFHVNDGSIVVNKTDTLLTSKLFIQERAGKINAKATLWGKSGTGRFKMDGNVENIDLSELGTMPLNKINVDLVATGIAHHYLPVKATASISGHDIELEMFTLDSAFTNLTYRKPRLSVDTLDIKSKQAHLQGRAIYQPDSLKFSYTVSLDNADRLLSWLVADTISANGDIRGELHLTSNHLDNHARFEFWNIGIKNIKCDSLFGKNRTRYRDNKWHVDISAALQRFSYAALLIDSMETDGHWQGDSIAAMVDIHTEKLGSSIDFSGHVGDSVSLKIKQLAIDVRDTKWQLQNPPLKVLITDEMLSIHRFYLYSANASLDASFFKTDSRFDLGLSAHRLPLSLANHFTDLPVNLNGFIDADLSGKGRLQQPQLDGRISIDSLMIDRVSLGTYRVRINYKDDLLTLRSHLSKKDSLVLNANLALDAQSGHFRSDSASYADLITTGYNLKAIDKISPNIIIQDGIVDMNLRLNNPLFTLDPSGHLRLNRGDIRFPLEGIDYPSINLDSEFSNQQLILHSAHIQSPKGSFSCQGRINIPFEWHDFINRSSVDLTFTADNFIPISDKELELVLDGKGSLQGKLTQPRIQTEATIQRAQVYVPAFMNGRPQPQYQPILLRDSLAQSSGINRKLDIFQKLSGTITVTIPRNTWLRGNEFNVELSGQMILEFKEDDLKLFGTLKTLRGTYDFFGKRFKLQKGNLTFQGDEVILDIEAAYIFRDSEKKRQKLILYLSGKSSNPDIRFEMNNIAIQERQAISYLIFGRSYQQLTHGEKSQLGEQNKLLSGQSVGQLLAGQLVDRLTTSLGESLDLDVVELKSSSDWRQASIVIGKYLTHDLYVSYERGLSMEQSNEINPEVIVLEYEITPSLFFQATHGSEEQTGFDLIFKWVQE